MKGFEGSSEKMKDLQRNNGSRGFELSLEPLNPRILEPFFASGSLESLDPGTLEP